MGKKKREHVVFDKMLLPRRKLPASAWNRPPTPTAVQKNTPSVRTASPEKGRFGFFCGVFGGRVV